MANANGGGPRYPAPRAYRVRRPPAPAACPADRAIGQPAVRDGGRDAGSSSSPGETNSGTTVPGRSVPAPARPARRRRAARWCRTPARTGVPRRAGQPVGQVGDGRVGGRVGGADRVEQDRLGRGRCRRRSVAVGDHRRRCRRRCRGCRRPARARARSCRAASATASGTSIRAWNASVNSSGTTTARCTAGRRPGRRPRSPGPGRSDRGTRRGSRRRPSWALAAEHRPRSPSATRGAGCRGRARSARRIPDRRTASGQHDNEPPAVADGSAARQTRDRARRSAGFAVRRCACGSAGRTSSARAGRDRCAGSSW